MEAAPLDPEEVAAQLRLMEELRLLEEGPTPEEVPGGPNDGELSYKIAALVSIQVVAIQFTQPLSWIGMNLSSAKEMRRLLGEMIEEIERAAARLPGPTP